MAAVFAGRHRGETVVVVSHGGAVSLAVPAVCRNADPALRRAHWMPPSVMAEVTIEARTAGPPVRTGSRAGRLRPKQLPGVTARTWSNARGSQR